MSIISQKFGKIHISSGIEQTPYQYIYDTDEYSIGLKINLPLARYMEYNMAYLDEIAKTHNWVETYSDDYRISSTGFKWYRYTPTKEEFVPSLYNDGASLSGTTYLYIDFWHRIRDVVCFINEKLLSYELHDRYGDYSISGIYMDGSRYTYGDDNNYTINDYGSISDFKINIGDYDEFIYPPSGIFGYVDDPKTLVKIPRLLFTEAFPIIRIDNGDFYLPAIRGPLAEGFTLVQSGWACSNNTNSITSTTFNEFPTLNMLELDNINSVSQQGYNNYIDNGLNYYVLKRTEPPFAGINTDDTYRIYDILRDRNYHGSNLISVGAIEYGTGQFYNIYAPILSENHTYAGQNSIIYCSESVFYYFPVSTNYSISNSGENLSLKTTHAIQDDDRTTFSYFYNQHVGMPYPFNAAYDEGYNQVNTYSYLFEMLKSQFYSYSTPPSPLYTQTSEDSNLFSYQLVYGFVDVDTPNSVFTKKVSTRDIFLKNEDLWPFLEQVTNEHSASRVRNAIMEAICQDVNDGNYTVLTSLSPSNFNNDVLNENSIDIVDMINSSNRGGIMYVGILSTITSPRIYTHDDFEHEIIVANAVSPGASGTYIDYGFPNPGLNIVNYNHELLKVEGARIDYPTSDSVAVRYDENRRYFYTPSLITYGSNNINRYRFYST